MPPTLEPSVTDLDRLINSNRKILDKLPEKYSTLAHNTAHLCTEDLITRLKRNEPHDFLAPFVASVIIANLCMALQEWKLAHGNKDSEHG